MNGRAIRFGLPDLREQLEAFRERWPDAATDKRASAWLSPDGMARLAPPILAPRVHPGESIPDYMSRCDVSIGLHVVLLVRAAGVALGYWEGRELLHHKAIRKYVIRGRGKAQQTFLKTQGKSRYGSRLRLQNWRRLLAETNERLLQWWDEPGRPERVFVSVPVRVMADLCAAEPPPPFQKGDPMLVRIPMHVHRPDHAELLRVHGELAVGRLDLPED